MSDSWWITAQKDRETFAAKAKAEQERMQLSSVRVPVDNYNEAVHKKPTPWGAHWS